MLSTILKKGEPISAVIKRQFDLRGSSGTAVIHTILTNSLIYIIDMIRLGKFKDIDKIFTGTEESLEILFRKFPALPDDDSIDARLLESMFREA